MLTAEQRRELVTRPFPITYVHSVKRWAGVQLGVYDEWYEHNKTAERYHLAQRQSDDLYAGEGGQW